MNRSRWMVVRGGSPLMGLLAFVTATAAQDVPSEPEVVAQQYMTAMKAADWAAAAQLMHPAALAQLRGFLTPLLSAEDGVEFVRMLYGLDSVEEFETLTDAQVFERFIAFMMNQDPEVMEVMRTAEMETLGHIMEGDTAHVVNRLRMEADGIQMSQMEVSSFMLHEGEWRGLLSGDLSGLAAALAKAVGGAG